jgi:protein subunit release factor B
LRVRRPFALRQGPGGAAGRIPATTEGEIVITADQHRTQAINRDDAVSRLVALLAAAAVPPKPRGAPIKQSAEIVGDRPQRDSILGCVCRA